MFYFSNYDLYVFEAYVISILNPGVVLNDHDFSRDSGGFIIFFFGNSTVTIGRSGSIRPNQISRVPVLMDGVPYFVWGRFCPCCCFRGLNNVEFVVGSAMLLNQSSNLRIPLQYFWLNVVIRVPF